MPDLAVTLQEGARPGVSGRVARFRNPEPAGKLKGTFKSFKSRMAKPGLALVATLLALVVGEGVIRMLRVAPEIKVIEVAGADCV